MNYEWMLDGRFWIFDAGWLVGHCDPFTVNRQRFSVIAQASLQLSTFHFQLSIINS